MLDDVVLTRLRDAVATLAHFTSGPPASGVPLADAFTGAPRELERVKALILDLPVAALAPLLPVGLPHPDYPSRGRGWHGPREPSGSDLWLALSRADATEVHRTLASFHERATSFDRAEYMVDYQPHPEEMVIELAEAERAVGRKLLRLREAVGYTPYWPDLVPEEPVYVPPEDRYPLRERLPRALAEIRDFGRPLAERSPPNVTDRSGVEDAAALAAYDLPEHALAVWLGLKYGASHGRRVLMRHLADIVCEGADRHGGEQREWAVGRALRLLADVSLVHVGHSGKGYRAFTLLPALPEPRLRAANGGSHPPNSAAKATDTPPTKPSPSAATRA